MDQLPKRYKIKIGPNDNAEEVSNRLSNLAAEKILDIIDDIYDDKIKFVDQDHLQATYAKKLIKVKAISIGMMMQKKLLEKLMVYFLFQELF